MYTIITENDDSLWNDDTGVLYHFPKRYAKLLLTGANVIYYKGKIRDKNFSSKRLSDEPHYFGIARIGKVFPDKESSKGDLFALIENFIPFEQPVLAKIDSGYYESIPESRKTNYWRNGVRPIDQNIFERIVGRKLDQGVEEKKAEYSLSATNESELESLQEGSKVLRYVAVYERNPKLRRQAIAIHGISCVACGFNFESIYGEYAKGFIHIHHTEPVSTFGESKVVDPENDLVPLCANCHGVVHRRKDQTLSISELKEMIADKSTKNKLKLD